MTDIGLTGGGKGSNMIYLSGIQDHKILKNYIINNSQTSRKKQKKLKNKS